MRPEVLQKARNDGCFLFFRTGAQGCGDDRLPAHHEPAQVEFGLRTALQADDHQPAVARECFRVLFEVGRTHDVEDDVSARPAAVVAWKPEEIGGVGLLGMPRDLFDAVNEVFFAVVDDGIRTQFAAELGLALTADSHGGFCSVGFGHLDGRGANTGTTAVDEHPFARLQARCGEQVGVHGGHDVRQRCCFSERHGTLGTAVRVSDGGDGHQLADGNGHVFGVASAGEQSRHAIADLHSRRAVCCAICRGTGFRGLSTFCLVDGDNGAGDFQAGDLRGTRGRTVVSFALHDVGPIDPGRGHSH